MLATGLQQQTEQTAADGRRREDKGDWTANRIQALATTGSGRETTPEGSGRIPVPPSIQEYLENTQLTG